MTARTQIVPVQLARDSATVLESAATAAASTMYIQGVNTSSPTSTIDLRRVRIRCYIGSTATVVTLHSTGNGVNVAGTAQTTPTAWNTVFTQSTAGDLVSASITSQTLDLGPLTTDRFIQTDSSGNTYFYLDFSNTTGVTVVATCDPFVLV